MSGDNIFSALAKYSSSADENYLTEAFVFLINSLLLGDRPVGLEILTRLCVVNDEFSFDTNEAISVSAQETTEQGIPDIKVSSPDKLIYIEVKDYSDVKPEQLKRYKQVLESSDVAIKRLILLTRFPVDFEEHQGIPDKHIRWFEVYNWLVSAKDKVQDSVSVYLIEQFISFLEVKHMSIQKVGGEYVNGVSAMNNLINMIDVAIQALSIKKKKSARWAHKGFYVEDNKLWCGIHYNNPLVMTFEMIGKNKFNAKLVNKPSYEVVEWKKRIWFRLPLEGIHFFSLDKDKQLEVITKFVKTAYAEAQKMRIP